MRTLHDCVRSEIAIVLAVAASQNGWALGETIRITERSATGADEPVAPARVRGKQHTQPHLRKGAGIPEASRETASHLAQVQQCPRLLRVVTDTRVRDRHGETADCILHDISAKKRYSLQALEYF
jgi:hypothetical protein